MEPCQSQLRNQTMAPESRPPNAPEPEDMQNPMILLANGLLAGAGEETFDEADNEVNSNMAVDALRGNMETITMQEPDQQIKGTRSTTHKHYTVLSLEQDPISDFIHWIVLLCLHGSFTSRKNPC